jgi:hypothetical protein
VEELEWEIHHLEKQMRSLGRRCSNTTKNSSVSSLIPHSNSIRSTSPLSEEMVQNLMYNWRFKIKNGSFRIETGIRNISDLLSYQPNIPYLSPFSSGSSISSSRSSVSGGSSFDESETYRGGESGFLMQFGTDAGELIPFTVRLLIQCAKKNYEKPASLLLPSLLLLDSKIVIDQILKIYFSCHNVYSPMIHERSFMEKYQKLQDPMTDLISVSLCAYVCSAPCDHFFFTPLERRSMADYFFQKAKSIILDQFDLPEKRLENVMSINLLSKYMHMTLKFKECLKWIMMAYQICLDLKNNFKYSKCAAAATSECLASSPTRSSSSFEDPTDTHLFIHLDPLPVDKPNALEEMLFSRHLSITLCTRRLMDYISNEVMDDACFHFPRWQYMEDESEETIRYIHSQNWVLGLFNHPFIGNFMVRRKNTLHYTYYRFSCTLI